MSLKVSANMWKGKTKQLLLTYRYFFVIFISLFFISSLCFAFDVMNVGVIENVDSEKELAFFNWVKDKEKYYSLPIWADRKKPNWANEFHSFSFRDFHFVCYEFSENKKKKCEVDTQYGPDEREKDYSGVSQFENLFSNRPFKYTRKFHVKEKDKIENALYIWVKNNTDKIPPENIPENIEELYAIKFDEFIIVCWQTDSVKSCEIDRF